MTATRVPSRSGDRAGKFVGVIEGGTGAGIATSLGDGLDVAALRRPFNGRYVRRCVAPNTTLPDCALDVERWIAASQSESTLRPPSHGAAASAFTANAKPLDPAGGPEADVNRRTPICARAVERGGADESLQVAAAARKQQRSVVLGRRSLAVIAPLMATVSSLG